MNALIDYGVAPKMSFDTMESVRKGRGLKPEMEEAMIEHNVPVVVHRLLQKDQIHVPEGTRGRLRDDGAAHRVVQGAPAGGVLLRILHRSGGLLRREHPRRNAGSHPRSRYKRWEENSKDLTQKDKDLMIIMELVIEMLCRGIKLA